MDATFLEQYGEAEEERCKRAFAVGRDSNLSKPEMLKTLYGIDPKRRIVCCESGGIENLDGFGKDTLVLMPLTLYKDLDDFKTQMACGIDEFLRLCLEERRVIPILQSSGWYEGREFLEPVFREVKPPSAFAAGNYVLATLLDMNSVELAREDGVPILDKAVDHMRYAKKEHDSWLDQIATDKKQRAWEYGWKGNDPGKNTLSRLRHRLAFRYASVAACIGRDETDYLISSYDPYQSANILLHLHYIFDHLFTKGLGEDYSIGTASAAIDEYLGVRTNVLESLELPMPFRVKTRLAKPSERPREVRDAWRELDPMRHIDQLREFRGDAEKFQQKCKEIQALVESAQNKIDKLDNRKDKLESWLEMLLVGTAIAGATIEPLFGALALGQTRLIQLPQRTSELVVDQFKKMYRYNLAIRIFNCR